MKRSRKKAGGNSGNEGITMCLGRLLNIIGLAISMLGTLLMLFGGFDAFVKIRPVGPAWRPNVSQACLGDEHGGYIQAGTKGLFIIVINTTNLTYHIGIEGSTFSQQKDLRSS